MKIDNLGTVMKDFEGVEYPHGENEKLTLRLVIRTALIVDIDGDPPEEKFSRWMLARQVNEATNYVDVTLEDAVKIKTRIAKVYKTEVAGQAIYIIEKGGKEDVSK